VPVSGESKIGPITLEEKSAGAIRVVGHERGNPGKNPKITCDPVGQLGGSWDSVNHKIGIVFSPRLCHNHCSGYSKPSIRGNHERNILCIFQQITTRNSNLKLSQQNS
jgi:hypothetical protein